MNYHGLLIFHLLHFKLKTTYTTDAVRVKSADYTCLIKLEMQDKHNRDSSLLWSELVC